VVVLVAGCKDRRGDNFFGRNVMEVGLGGALAAGLGRAH